MRSGAAADLFGLPTATIAAEMPVEVMRGLDQLAGTRPMWPIEAVRWAAVVASVQSFARYWDAAARACGWSDVQLYGLHRRAPFANLAAMGAAFVLARGDRHAIGVDPTAIAVAGSADSRMQLYRREVDIDAVLAWELVSGQRERGNGAML